MHLFRRKRNSNLPPLQSQPQARLQSGTDPRIDNFRQSLPAVVTEHERKIAGQAEACFLKHVNELRDKLDDVHEKREEDARKAKYDFSIAKSQHEQETQGLRTELRNERLKNQRNERETKAKYDQEKQRLLAEQEKQQFRFQREQEDAKIRHDQECHRLHEQHERTSQDFQRKIFELNQKNAQAIRTLHSQLNAAENYNKRERAELQSRHDQAVRELNSKHRQEVDDVTRSELNAKKRHEAETQALKQSHSQETEARKDRYAADIQKLKADHTMQTQHLREQVRELNSALLSRDNEVYLAPVFSTSGLPDKTDAKLIESFSEILRLVNDISGLSWRPDQNVCPERSLQRHSAKHSLRRLKKAILEDIIWCILYHHVLASPFRMFGDSGKELEHQWSANRIGDPSLALDERSGQHGIPSRALTASSDTRKYQWPLASTATERWRYMTLQRCKEVLSQSILSQFDPRAQLKKGYSDTIASLTAELKDTIQSLASVDDQAMDSLNKLPKKISKVWLDFSMHRPRVVVDMLAQGYLNVSQRFDQIGRGEVVLTSVPTLGRYGDNEGADLDRFTLLEDGASITLP